MDKTLDKVFGEMELKHGWQKKQTILFWDKDIVFKIKAAQYSNKEITDTQRKNYQYVLDNIQVISSKSKTAIGGYIKKNEQIIKSGLINENDLSPENLVSPRTMIFFADGKYGILFDCKWDEHGLAVTLPDYAVGPQDILL
jgi:hypothetical protein